MTPQEKAIELVKYFRTALKDKNIDSEICIHLSRYVAANCQRVAFDVDIKTFCFWLEVDNEIKKII